MNLAKRIAVLSDTHGLLRPEVVEAIAGCDAIIHGGDINKPEITERLQEIAPVYVVWGNNDKEWAEHIPATLTFQIEDCRFFLVHNKKEVPKDLTGIDAALAELRQLRQAPLRSGDYAGDSDGGRQHPVHPKGRIQP